MARTVIPDYAAFGLPRVCVLTGTDEDIEDQPFTFSRTDGIVPGIGTVKTCRTLPLPVNRKAAARLLRLRVSAAVLFAVAVFAILFFVVALAAGDPPYVRGTVATVAAIATTVALVKLHRSAPRLLILGEDSTALEIPSAEAARAIDEHVDELERAQRRREKRRRARRAA